MTIKIPLEDLLNVLPFKGRDDTRWVLNGVLVEPWVGEPPHGTQVNDVEQKPGALLTCTNGHVCGFLYSATAVVTERRVLDIDDNFMRGLRDVCNPERHHLSLEMDHLVVKSKADVEYLIKPGLPFIDSKFPDATKVIPKAEELEPGLSSVVSSVYLSQLRRKRVNGYDRGVMFWQRKDRTKDQAVVARFLDLPNLVVLVMPIRGDRFETALPEWLPLGP